jgi:hypothetical protein
MIWASLHLLRLTAGRLQWLHCFTRNERWKEEVILVAEEIRRVGAWYRYQLSMAKVAANRESHFCDDDWVQKGIKALLNKRALKTEKEYQGLPSIAKLESAKSYEDILLSYSAIV